MKKLILSAMMLTGVVAFAQETPKKSGTKDVMQTTTTTINTDKSAEVTKTTESKQDANGDQQIETTTTKAPVPAQTPTPVESATPAQPTTPVEPTTKTTLSDKPAKTSTKSTKKQQ